MSVPKADAGAKAFFDSLVPDDPRVTVRPMFGNFAAFVNGTMFLALLGDQIAVRLGDEDRAELRGEKGSSSFEPMPGRPMKEYATLPAAWRKRPAKAEAWVERSLHWAAVLPPKKKKVTHRNPEV